MSATDPLGDLRRRRTLFGLVHSGEDESRDRLGNQKIILDLLTIPNTQLNLPSSSLGVAFGYLGLGEVVAIEDS